MITKLFLKNHGAFIFYKNKKELCVSLWTYEVDLTEYNYRLSISYQKASEVL